jgi:hypothetical protein
MRNAIAPKLISVFIMLWALSILCIQSQADTVLLTNGDSITGDIQEINDTTLAIKPAYAPLINIDKNSVKSFATNQSRNWKIKKSESEDAIESSTKAELSTTSQHVLVNGEIFTVDDIMLSSTVTKPKWQITGNLETSLDVDKDDKSTEKLHLNTDLTFESKTWRHNIKSEIKHEQEDSKKTEDNREITYALDYFITSHWLIRNENFYREDNLNNSSEYKYIELGPGYRLWGEGKDKLDFITSYNRLWLQTKNITLQLNAWALGVDYKQFWFNEKLETYADFHVMYPNWNKIDYISNSTIGLRYLLTHRVFVSAKYDFNETKTILGTDNDHSYTIGAGVNF